MDPLSIMGGTTALIGQIAKVTKVLHDLYTTLKDAPRLLTSIMTECTVMRTTLCALEDMQNRTNHRISFISEQIFNSFNMAMACCEMILTDLEKDAQTCLKAGKDPNDKDAIRRCNVILSKVHLQELLMQLNGQKQAIQLLLTTWQSRDAEQMRRREEDNRDVLRGIARRVIRRYTTDDDSSAKSSITSEKFGFDQELLSSPRYQRAIRYLRKMESRQTELGGSTPEPEHEPIGLGILHLSDEPSSMAPESSIDTDSLHVLSRQHSTLESPATPTINVSYHLGEQDIISPVDQTLMVEDTISPRTVAEDTSPKTFTYKRRSMPPMYSQIQSVAMSPDALLGVVNRSQRHRRARSEGNEAMPTPPPPVAHLSYSPVSSTFTFHDSAISDADYTLDDASKDDFDADFDEFWIHQGHRETYRRFPMPSRKVVFLGDCCVRPLWSNMQAASSPGIAVDDKDAMESCNLRVAIDDVSFDLDLIDMTGDHQDFAAAILEPEAHIAVLVYAIDNPYSLTDVLNKWVVVVRDIYPALPLFLLGCSRESRANVSLCEWLKGMDQIPVTYAEGAAVFRSLYAEAFLEISSNDKTEATEFFETLSKTLVRLHHEELRGITSVSIENERIRLSPSSPLLFRNLHRSIFTILPQQDTEVHRTSPFCELDAASSSIARASMTKDEATSDAVSLQRESLRLHVERENSVEDRDQMIAPKPFGSENPINIVEISPEMVNPGVESDDTVSSIARHPDPSNELDAPRASCTPRKAVLLRIDSELSQRYRPKEIQIIKPQSPEGIQNVHRNPRPEAEAPSPDTNIQQYIEHRPASVFHADSTDGGEGPSNIQERTVHDDDDLRKFDDNNKHTDDDNDTDYLDIPNSNAKRQSSDSPYILPDLPEFEALTPKLMQFLFSEDLETT